MNKKEGHMDWSEKQRRILTANGMSEQWYTPEFGFAFNDQELPHYHMSCSGSTTQEIFTKWKTGEETGTGRAMSPIAGVWKRPLFYGGFEYTTDKDEFTYNVQTNTLFIDMRIPVTRDALLIHPSISKIQSLEDLNGEQLRMYARQHIFAGYTMLEKSSISSRSDKNYPYCATRHHCMDWNYVGIPRSRPNKWWVELPGPVQSRDDTKAPAIQQWKEWAYATDPYKQHYYCEHWERRDTSFPTPSDAPTLSLRKKLGRDGILIFMGDHVMYCLDRCSSNPQHTVSSTCTSLAAIVDEAVQKNNDCATARTWLSMQGGHGRWISSYEKESKPDGSGSWILDHCIDFWRQGQPLFERDDAISVTGTSIEQCTVRWSNESWMVFECNLSSLEEVRNLLLHGPFSVRLF